MVSPERSQLLNFNLIHSDTYMISGATKGVAGSQAPQPKKGDL